MCPLKSKTLRGIVPASSFDIAGTLQVLPPVILTIFSGAGYCGHRSALKAAATDPVLICDPASIRTNMVRTGAS
jgi:hypothetical protein